MLQVASYYGQAVFERSCSDPDVLDADRPTLCFERRQQVSGPQGFGLTEWQNLDEAQNLARNSFPETFTVFDASRPMTKLGDAYH